MNAIDVRDFSAGVTLASGDLSIVIGPLNLLRYPKKSFTVFNQGTVTLSGAVLEINADPGGFVIEPGRYAFRPAAGRTPAEYTATVDERDEKTKELVRGKSIGGEWPASDKFYVVTLRNFRRTDGGTFALLTVTAPNVTQFTDQSAVPGTRYVYRVRAFKRAGDSTPSNEATVAPPRSMPSPAA